MGTDKAIAEFVVHQISLWTGYSKVAETVVDVAKLARALGLVDGVKGVDARVRHHLPQEALALENTTVWDQAQQAAARICQHANIDWQDLVTDLSKVKAWPTRRQSRLGRTGRCFGRPGSRRSSGRPAVTRPGVHRCRHSRDRSRDAGHGGRAAGTPTAGPSSRVLEFAWLPRDGVGEQFAPGSGFAGRCVGITAGGGVHAVAGAAGCRPRRGWVPVGVAGVAAVADLVMVDQARALVTGSAPRRRWWGQRVELPGDGLGGGDVGETLEEDSTGHFDATGVGRQHRGEGSNGLTFSEEAPDLDRDAHQLTGGEDGAEGLDHGGHDLVGLLLEVLINHDVEVVRGGVLGW